MPLTLEERIARFASVKLSSDLSMLNPGQREAIQILAIACKLMDDIYIRQMWSKNEEIMKKLEENKEKSEQDNLLYQLSRMYRCPWDPLENKEPLISYVPSSPHGANFYPEDMTKEEFKQWISTLSKEDKLKAEGARYLIRRNTNTKQLQLIPYSEAYQDLLSPIANLLEKAAETIGDESLKKFLMLRAESFRTNDYVESELAWLAIKTDSLIEVVCGPYMFYTDKLFGFKSAFVMYIHICDQPSTEKLHLFTNAIATVENQLPIPDKYKNKNLKRSPIIVVNEIYNGGDVALPCLTAYNLPTDYEIEKQAGSKLTLIKNVQEAKFNKVLRPIAEVILDPEQLKFVSWDAFFIHILLHEVSHSNGPHETVGPNPVLIQSRLQEHHSALEEAKADVTGLFAADYFVKNGQINDISMESFYVTYLANQFRFIRQGQTAHALGQKLQHNYLLDHGGIEYDNATQKFRVNFDRIRNTIASLTNFIMIIQGDGDKDKAKEAMDSLTVTRSYTETALKRLTNVAFDIHPTFAYTP